MIEKYKTKFCLICLILLQQFDSYSDPSPVHIYKMKRKDFAKKIQHMKQRNGEDLIHGVLRLCTVVLYRIKKLLSKSSNPQITET